MNPEKKIENGIYIIEKKIEYGKIFGNLFVKERFYVTIDGTDVEVKQKVYNKLKDGEEVCVLFPSIFYERRGRPLLLVKNLC